MATTHITQTNAEPEGLATLKQAHRATWASGSYASVAERIVDHVIPAHVLSQVTIEPGMRVLDLAAGTGNVAVRAARQGARVTAVDLTPELFERGRERAAQAGVEIDWIEGDAEDLPFADASFDMVLSTLGIQFAPRHVVAASEAVRVARPGATIALVNWSPRGHIGCVLKAVGARMPKPPAFVSPPPLWGDEDHVRSLLEPLGVELSFASGVNDFTGFASAEEWVDYMAINYGPLLKARERLAPAGEWDALRDEVVDITRSFATDADGGIRIDSEYLLVLGTLR